MTEQVHERLLTKRQISEILAIHPRTVTRMMAEGTIPVIRVGISAVRFRLSDVLRVLEERK